MKKNGLVFLYILFLIQAGWPQSSNSGLVDTFIANFKKGNMNVKLEVLKDAALTGDQGMGPLYVEAIDYVITNIHLIDTQLSYRELSMLAVRNIQQVKYVPAKTSLWKLFEADTNTIVRVGILNALSDIAAGDTYVIRNLNNWLTDQHDDFKTGQRTDFQVIGSCIDLLGRFGDPSSFPILFRTLLINYSAEITTKAETAMLAIKGDRKELYTTVIKSSLIEEKNLAIAKVIADKDFTDTEKCEISELTLSIALNTLFRTPVESDLARQMRYQTINFLGQKGWSNSTPLLIEHFNKTINEMDKGIGGVNYLLDAVIALGNMKNPEAAKRLTLYLDHINAFTENGTVFNEQIVLAVISSLENLGDAVARSTLLYTKYLNYSDKIKKAAANAVTNLK